MNNIIIWAVIKFVSKKKNPFPILRTSMMGGKAIWMDIAHSSVRPYFHTLQGSRNTTRSIQYQHCLLTIIRNDLEKGLFAVYVAAMHKCIPVKTHLCSPCGQLNTNLENY